MIVAGADFCVRKAVPAVFGGRKAAKDNGRCILCEKCAVYPEQKFYDGEAL